MTIPDAFVYAVLGIFMSFMSGVLGAHGNGFTSAVFFVCGAIFMIVSVFLAPS